MAMIDGVYMDRSLHDFAASCEFYIEAELNKSVSDTGLIALLMDGVRLTREMALLDTRRSDATAHICALMHRLRQAQDVQRKVM